jgi:alkaline phosphatase
LKDQKIAVGTFSEMVKKMIAAKKLEITFEEVEPLVVEKFGLKKLNDKERSALKEAFNADIDMVKRNIKDTKAHNVQRVYLFAQAVKNVLNSRAGVGWSSFSHTALPTLTTAKGPGADILFGIVENSDLGTRLKQLVAGE